MAPYDKRIIFILLSPFPIIAGFYLPAHKHHLYIGLALAVMLAIQAK